MKYLLTMLLALAGWTGFAQAPPLLRNSFTTNSVGKLYRPLTTTTVPLYPAMVQDPSGSGADLFFQYAPSFFVSNGIGFFTGSLRIPGLAGGKIIYSLAGSRQVAEITVGDGLAFSGGTLSASGGSGLDTSVTSLGWSGTNLTGFNCATNGATFKVTLTNNAFLADSTFSNLPDTATMKQWTLLVQEDGTGGWVLNGTNTVLSAADGVFPQVWTNAGGITWYYFHTDLTTNNTLAVIANVNVHR